LREEVPWESCPEITIGQYPTPTPSNPQDNPERPTQPKGTRPPLPTDRERGSERGEGDLDGLERGTGG